LSRGEPNFATKHAKVSKNAFSKKTSGNKSAFSKHVNASI
jgi:hypothetical protein